MSQVIPNPPAAPGFNISAAGLAQALWIEGGVDSIGTSKIGTTVNPTAVVIVGAFSNLSVLTSLKRTLYTVTTLDNVVGISTINGNPNRNNFWRDPTQGLAGFYLRMIFGCENVGANPDSWFAGVGTAPANINTVTSAPSASITDFFGILKDRTDTNWQFARRTANGAATKVDLGIAPAVGQIWIVEIASPAAGGALRLKASRMISASSSVTVIDSTVTTVLPTVSQSLALFLGGVAAGTGDTGIAIVSVVGQNATLAVPTSIQ